MHFTLSWDLFVIVFFALVMTYTFIIGKKESVKIIVSSYIAIIAVQSFVTFAGRVIGVLEFRSLLSMLGVPFDSTVTSVVKLGIFVVVIVFLAVRSGLHVQYGKDGNMAVNIATTALCGFATAGMLLATLITFISGAPFLGSHGEMIPALATVVKQSDVMQFFVNNLDLWFALPAVTLIGVGFLGNE